MSVLLVGISHRTAPVDLLERVVLTDGDAGKLLDDVVRADHCTEAVVLTTCNRLEAYVEVDKFHGGVADVTELIARHTGVALDALTPHLYVHYEERAIAHLFSVACGLDSMVVGESQVLGQVRRALAVAQDAGTAGRSLNDLLQQALRVGKRARSETGIDRAGRSLVGVALDLAGHRLGGLARRRVAVVGAGSMAALATTMLAARDVAHVAVVNRTLAHAQSLARQLRGARTSVEARPLNDLADAVAEVDVVVSCTGAVGVVIPAEALARGDATAERVVLDLAMPHDVDPAAAALPGLTLVGLETLADLLRDERHGADVAAVQALVTEEVAAYAAWQRGNAVAPTVVALRGMADDVVGSELARLHGRVPDLDDRVAGEVELTVRRVVDKLLHPPTVRIKELAAEPGGSSYAEALRALFGLDLGKVDAVTRPASSTPGPAGPPEMAS